MATQATTELERVGSREEPSQREGESGTVSQRDTWETFVDTLSQQFGEAIDPVLGELPQRMAKAIQANLTKDGETVARFLPQEPGEPGEPQGETETARAGSGSSKRGDDGTDAAPPENQRGGDSMARADTTSQERDRQSRDGSNGSDRRRSAGRRSYHFDADGATRAGLLRLAASSNEAGAPFQAIRIYTQVLERYPNSGAADAATEELLNLAETLEQRGMYSTAAGILEKLYQYS